MNNHDNIAKNISQVTAGTLISRIFGLAREVVIAGFFGATMAADAFFVAYKIPNLLRRLLGEGSLSTSFIPVFTEYITNKGEKESKELLRAAFGAFGIIFIILTFLGIIFAPQIVSVVALGFTDDPEKFRLTVILTRIMFPFLMAIGLGAIALGALNSLRLFFVPAAAPSLLSISEILFVLLVSPALRLPVMGLAYGVVAGGFAQLFVQLVPIIKRHHNIFPVINLNHPGLKRVIMLMLPAIIGLSIMQINSFVDTVCATLLKSGSVSHLYYGNRVMQLPLALFGTAIATVTLPVMSENAARKEMTELKDTFSFSLRAISFLVMPATVGLIVFGSPIIELLFQRGAFLPADTVSTYSVLAYYSAGLVFFAGVKAGVSAFHSLQDTKTPVIIASIAMIINVALNIAVVTVDYLKTTFSAGGLALATSISSAVNFILLIIIFRKRNGKIGGKRISVSVAKHLAASLLLGVFLYYAAFYTSGVYIYIRTPLIIIISAFVYFFLSHLFSVSEIERVKRVFLGKNEINRAAR